MKGAAGLGGGALSGRGDVPAAAGSGSRAGVCFPACRGAESDVRASGTGGPLRPHFKGGA